MGQEAVIAVGTIYVDSLNKALWWCPQNGRKPPHNPYLNYKDALLLAYIGLRSGLEKTSLPVDQQEIVPLPFGWSIADKTQ